ncbi:MAG: thermonuclease family protein [Thermoleophilia bacterium]|nr:thermonuclease family protein [Thermoleophilia bacterium]
MRAGWASVTILLASLLAGCGAGGDPAGGVIARVDRVVDGDTLIADGRRVRLIGIDTPESADPRQAVECYGREAAAFARRLLPPGTTVRLERDVEARDRFGRDLAYVHRVRDDLFVNAELVRQGYATPFTVPPNDRLATTFVRLAGEARTAGRGLWSAC